MRARAVIKAQDPLETAFRNVHKNQRELARQIRSLRSQMLSPTVPIMDPDYPSDAVVGQFAISTDPPPAPGDVVMRPYYNDANGWHPISTGDGATFKWAWINASGVTIATTGLNSYPWDTGGATYETDPDPGLYEYDLTGSPNGIIILKAGLYIVRHCVFWQGDWGPCTIETIVDGPDIQGWNYNVRNKDGVYMGEGTNLFTFRLVSEQLVAIVTNDGVQPVMEINNQWAGASARSTTVQQFVMRLSSSPYANQRPFTG